MISSLRKIAERTCTNSAVMVTMAGAFVVSCDSEDEARAELLKLVDAYKAFSKISFVGEIEDGVLFEVVPKTFSTTYIRIITAPSDRKLLYVESYIGRGR